MTSAMDIAAPDLLSSGAHALRATAGAVLGQPGGVFGARGEFFGGFLTIDENASVPSVALLRPGTAHRAVVQVGPDRPGLRPRKLCIKIPDAYGPGKDQDFLLASSGDGAPLHHVVMPAEPVASLYSSLWLYLAGLQPVLFGVRPSTTGPDLRFGSGDEVSFLISAPVGQFRRIGSLRLTGPLDGPPVRFSGGNSGGSIRPLPPVTFY
ncbi:hypothetical protein Mycch_0056 [Mycolicibacterium chubuense NBB4]|uniref:Uncharacterized protein n=2 Tax=Mycolicibacterium chubuense TaxID=1800 RepID=I4BC77_MYCCN|nr:hypothetical protein Mycch_0056 [Mycolicibacterium chubuense NBB4]